MSPEQRRRRVMGVDDLPAPLDLAGLVRATWGLYRRRLRLWVTTCFVGYLALHLLQIAAIQLFLRGALTRTGEDVVEFIRALILVALTGIVVNIVLIPAMVAAVHDVPISFRQSARRAFRRGRHVLITAQYAVLLSLLVLLPPFGFLFFIVGNEIMLAMVAGPPVMIHAVIHERVTAREAWSRTKEIMRGQWLRMVMNILTVILGLGILQYVVIQGFAVVATELGFGTDAGIGIVLFAAQTLFAAFALPLIFLAWFVSYLDARSRKEELTRELLRAEFDAQGAESQAGLTGP